MLHYIRLERLTDKDANLLDPFVSYDKNEVLWIQLLVSYYKTIRDIKIVANDGTKGKS
jgi:hypothetical protein